MSWKKYTEVWGSMLPMQMICEHAAQIVQLHASWLDERQLLQKITNNVKTIKIHGAKIGNYPTLLKPDKEWKELEINWHRLTINYVKRVDPILNTIKNITRDKILGWVPAWEKNVLSWCRNMTCFQKRKIIQCEPQTCPLNL